MHWKKKMTKETVVRWQTEHAPILQKKIKEILVGQQCTNSIEKIQFRNGCKNW